MARIETLTINDGQMPSMDLREVKYRSLSFGPRDKYEISLEAHGLSASRGLELADLVAIRDWCEAAITAAGYQVAAE
ncbi:hypothetical protein [Devosia sp. 2618]|uniref:hypothetical protein n=1 Tax=Devosia sp. 2618 TaxID=3156454 RepID=UPI003395248F